MKHLYLVKVLVSDLENFYIEAKSKEEAKIKALQKISKPQVKNIKDHINDFTQLNHSLRIKVVKRIKNNSI